MKHELALIVRQLADDGASATEILTQNIVSARGKTVRPKTLNQKRYVDAIDQHAAAGHVVEALRESKDRRFAGTRRADQGDPLADAGAEVDAAQGDETVGVRQARVGEAESLAGRNVLHGLT